MECYDTAPVKEFVKPTPLTLPHSSASLPGGTEIADERRGRERAREKGRKGGQENAYVHVDLYVEEYVYV